MINEDLHDMLAKLAIVGHLSDEKDSNDKIKTVAESMVEGSNNGTVKDLMNNIIQFLGKRMSAVLTTIDLLEAGSIKALDQDEGVIDENSLRIKIPKRA